MKFYRLLIILLFISIFTLNFVSAEDYNIEEFQLDDTNTVYVNGSYDGRIEDGTQNHPYKSIYTGATIVSRQSKNNLFIANGEYQISRAVSFKNTNINIIGESTNVILNARETSTIFQFTQGNFTIYNIKFTNGNGVYTNTKTNGGAISINASSNTYYKTTNFNSLIIWNCIFEKNTAYSGGAISAENINLTIHNSNFINNNATNGGALFIQRGNLLLDNTNLQYNSGEDGGAIHTANSYVTIKNSKINENTGTNGGGAYLTQGILEITQSEFGNNKINGTHANGGAIYIYEATGNITNSNIYSNKVSGEVISSSAIFNVNTIGLTIKNSQIINNQLNGAFGFGNIISNKGTLTIQDSTITGNTMNVTNNIDDLIYNANGKINSNNNIINNNKFTGGNNNDNLYLMFNPYLLGNMYEDENIIIPQKYDLRNITLANGSTTSWLTSVKNQGNYGTCWAFATLGALESNILMNTGEYYDFSVNNMKNSMSDSSKNGYDFDTSNGGNLYLSSAYLTRWSGPVNETDDPYDGSKKTSPDNLTTIKHIQDIVFIPLRENFTDLNEIKIALMKYGALAVTYYSSDEDRYIFSINRYDVNIYEPIPSQTNHGVIIVGWDDTYSASNFKSKYGQPEGDGAFIIKNSWGSNVGDNGYYYVSYYDGTFTSLGGGGFSAMAFKTVENTTNYKEIYEYDPLGDTFAFLGYNNETAWFANIYTAESDNPLQAFSLISSSPNSQYYAKIYVNNELKLTTNGILKEPGYHTIKLDNYIKLNTGDIFKIIVKLTTPNFNYPIAIETKIDDLSTKAHAEAGQSYISPDGEKWQDISKNTVVIANSGNYYERANLRETNVCIKAFTAYLDETTVTCENFTSVYGEVKNLIGKLIDNESKPIIGQHISLTLTRPSSGASKTYDVVTDYTGFYKLEIHLAPGNYTAKAQFNGNGNLKYSNSSITPVKVKTDNRTDTKISIKYNETKEETILRFIIGKLTLEDNTPLTNEKINFKLTRISSGASKTYQLTTNENGEIIFNLNLANGIYQILCTYDGSTEYYPSSNEYTVTITT